jgi:magnesium-transporting ATPase (P-type)
MRFLGKYSWRMCLLTAVWFMQVNELTSAHRLTTLRQLLSFFANPVVIILLIASIISAFGGEPINAAIIALVVLSVALNFIQTSCSQPATERLRRSHRRPGYYAMGIARCKLYTSGRRLL